jgi:exodeoxyribonuclease-3|tara:strand:+ start:180 stop:941 length:762 start_codon:yes stop_codon:yes gene_type:complete
MKLVSWNVNGIRACITKGFLDFVKKENPDILCLQEIKAHPEQADMKLSQYEHHYWNPAERKGYSGVAIFSKEKPLSIQNGMGLLDEEGRVITLEFEDFYLVNVYTPNSKRGLERLDFRYKKWDKQFLKHIKSLDKPVIFCGDLNVAHEEIDIARPQGNKTTKTRPGNPGFTDKERERFSDILKAGFIDTYRNKNPEIIKYSWWSYMAAARSKNIGWRIDYFIVSESLKNRIKHTDILDQVMGSDHCPILLEIF